jgi:hypothetical protein
MDREVPQILAGLVKESAFSVSEMPTLIES